MGLTSQPTSLSTPTTIIIAHTLAIASLFIFFFILLLYYYTTRDYRTTASIIIVYSIIVPYHTLAGSICSLPSCLPVLCLIQMSHLLPSYIALEHHLRATNVLGLERWLDYLHRQSISMWPKLNSIILVNLFVFSYFCTSITIFVNITNKFMG